MRFQWLVLDFSRFRQESKEEGRILYYQLPPLSCPHWSFIFPDLVPSFFKVLEGLKHTYYPSPELNSELPQRARVITGKIKAVLDRSSSQLQEEMQVKENALEGAGVFFCLDYLKSKSKCLNLIN